MHGRLRYSRAFGDNLRAARLARGLTQQRLADMAGLTVTGVAYLERGERVPSLLTAARLAAVLGVSVSDLCPSVMGE